MSAPQARRRSAGIDLIRGLAVALVMLRHAAPDVFAGAGVVGVVMFFALSGYLITGLLADELGATGTVDLRRFYRRRAARLVPALLALVLGVVMVTLLLDPLGDRSELDRTVLVALTWTGNLPFGHASDATFHLWTLATEEQFYLVWPLVLLLAWRAGRVPAVVLGSAAACVVACVATLLWLADAPDLAYALPTSWAVCFVVGGVVALGRDRLQALPLGPAVVGGALLGLAVLSVVQLRGHPLTYLAGGPAIAVLTGVLLLAWHGSYDVRPALRPLVWLGGVSYAAYLWNYPLTLWLRAGLDHQVAAGLLAATLTLVLAAASTRWVEEPVLRRRDRDDARPTPAAVRA